MPHIGWQNKLQVCSHEVWSRVRVGLFKQVITIDWNQKFHARSKMVCWEQQFARWGGGVAEGERLHGGSNISTSAGVEMDPCQKKLLVREYLLGEDCWHPSRWPEQLSLQERQDPRWLLHQVLTLYGTIVFKSFPALFCILIWATTGRVKFGKINIRQNKHFREKLR